MIATSSAPASPFHEGELAIQERLGVKEKVARFGERGILPFLPDQHREFFEELPFVFVASLDGEGQPWASMVWGLPGFVTTPDATTLKVAGTIATGDPLVRNLVVGVPLGVLGIELETRRRNRTNGTVVGRDSEGFTVHVTQSFGNCQKYIQVRHVKYRRDPSARAGAMPRPEGQHLSADARRIVSAADTFFVASRSANPAEGTGGQGVDVSHRGGLPGFAVLADDGPATVITFPDYVGNFLFNTLGNVKSDPRVGLLFVDFDQRSLLSLTGRAEIIWDGPEVSAVAGAQRLVRVTVRSGVLMDDALPFSFSEPSFAPQFRLG